MRQLHSLRSNVILYIFDAVWMDRSLDGNSVVLYFTSEITKPLLYFEVVLRHIYVVLDMPSVPKFKF